MSAYIPTNVISITDGQIFLETDLFFQGIRPGGERRSVGVARRFVPRRPRPSRRSPARSRASSRSTAKWRRSRSSAPISTPSTQRLLNRGARLTELLKQPQFSPLKMEEQVCVIWAGTNGYLDPLPLNKVRAFEDGLLSLLRGKNAEILNAIRDSRDLSDDTAAKLKSVVEGFAKSFA